MLPARLLAPLSSANASFFGILAFPPREEQPVQESGAQLQAQTLTGSGPGQ